jgi:hypothetical protein
VADGCFSGFIVAGDGARERTCRPIPTVASSPCVKDSTRHGVYARICDAPDASPPGWGAEFRVGFERPFSFRLNKPAVLSTGEWIMPVMHALEPVVCWAGFDPKQIHGVGISTDEGKTWTLHGAVRTLEAESRQVTSREK